MYESHDFDFLFLTNSANWRISSSSSSVYSVPSKWAAIVSDVTFTLPANAASADVIFYVLQLHFRGTSYIDCLQVEEGQVGNRRNLVENNDFTERYSQCGCFECPFRPGNKLLCRNAD
ncbi:hypothetical protein [Frisingicoccus sp.]|uniref:hypothetical protein n=1 Tax=Frisingicoccus sp. TaxID=1918627 RepID=UPI003AB87832